MNLSNYIKETRMELNQVNWPTQKQTVAFTGIVIGVSLVTAILLGLFDGVFGWGLQQLVNTLN